MKKFLKLGFLASLFSIFCSGESRAVTQLGAYNTDLFLGFTCSTTGGTGAYSSVLMDLGASQNGFFGNGNVSLDQSATNSVLSLAFGSNWWTRSDVSWFALSGNQTNIYISSITGKPQISSPITTSVSGSTRKTNTISVDNVNQIFTTLQNSVSTQNSASFTNVAYIGGLTPQSAIVSYDIPGSAATAFTSQNWGDYVDSGGGQTAYTVGAAGSLIRGSSNSVLTLWNYTYTNGAAYIVTNIATPILTVNNNNGVLAFAIPEPSHWALMALSILTILVLYRGKVGSKQS